MREEKLPASREPGDWRELLKSIISDPQEKKRLSESMVLNAVTIARWANGETTPGERNLRQLVSHLKPPYQSLMLEQLRREFQGFDAVDVQVAVEQIIPDIPPIFLVRILQTYTSTAPHMRYWSIASLLVQQLTQLLDAKLEFGLAIFSCTPPTQKMVKSFYLSSLLSPKRVYVGIPAGETYFLGIGSLLGRLSFSQPQPHVFEAPFWGFELVPTIQSGAKSIGLFPILRAGQIAGFLCLWSEQEMFRRELCNFLEQYTYFLSLAYKDDNFYAPEVIALQHFISLEEQQKRQSTHQEDYIKLRQRFPEISVTELNLLFLQQTERQLEMPMSKEG